LGGCLDVFVFSARIEYARKKESSKTMMMIVISVVNVMYMLVQMNRWCCRRTMYKICKKECYKFLSYLQMKRRKKSDSASKYKESLQSEKKKKNQ